MLGKRLVLTLFMFIGFQAHAMTVDLAENGSFEIPEIAQNTFQLGVNAPGWTLLPALFNGQPSGIWPVSGNSGSQYADIGNLTSPEVAQSFTVPFAFRLYSINWYANTSIFATSVGYSVRLVNGSGSTVASGNFQVSPNVNLWTMSTLMLNSRFGPGSYTVIFQALSGLDALIDDVTIEAKTVPIPAALPLLLAGLGALAALRRRRS